MHDWNYKLKKCVICKKEFKLTNGKNSTCSKKCSYKRKREYDKKYAKKHPKQMAEWQKKSIKRNRDKVNARARRRYQRDKKIIKVRNATNQLIKKLGLKKYGKCMDCGETKKLEMHHITYTIDDFILICQACHLKRHKKRLRKCEH